MTSSSTLQSISLALSPSGHLYSYSDPDNQERLPATLAEKTHTSFAANPAHALLQLGLSYFNTQLPPSLAFWQKLARLFLTEVCKLSGFGEQAGDKLPEITLPLTELTALLEQAPFMRGAEYLNQDVLLTIAQSLTVALRTELLAFNGSLAAYLESHHAAWNKVGRVCFHLAENKADPNHPFAFLATYTSRLSSDGVLQHLPLGRALQEYAGEQKRQHLLALLLPVQKAATTCAFLKELVDKNALFQPLAWTASQAYQFLQAIPHMEAAGLTVRVPDWWNPKKPPRPQVKIAVGEAQTNMVGLDALLDFDMQVALPSGEQLSLQELKKLSQQSSQLVQIKGHWVEVDGNKLNQVLSHWQNVAKAVKREGLSFAEGLRLLAGASDQSQDDIPAETVADWSTRIEGEWLRKMLADLRQPEQLSKQTQILLQRHLHASLRPYQQVGVQWLWMLYQLRLGGCLADDMGLGKTIQVLSLLLLVKHQPSAGVKAKMPHLLVLPASLLGNWQAEIQRFAPDLKSWVAHSSAGKSNTQQPDLADVDVVITTYAYVHRLAWLKQVTWEIVIVDEAQSIKNPSSKQTQAIKSLTGRVRFILTGTPIENRLLDLWSLFDFVAPGLLGSSRTFADYGKKASQQTDKAEGRFYAAVRQLVSPYILRRLKSDKRIIADLPDKTELDAWCTLTRQQVTLYQQAVDELAHKLELQKTDGIARRGLVLSYLSRFKQICNHASQWLGHGQYDSTESGKFLRLQEICEAIAAKQEKVLVFTQFSTIIPALNEFLAGIFKRPGLVLHGKTAIKERAKLVAAFQEESGPPFFVLSLKAGGTGLNLTSAAHVIHFDRWWNPAVENQATDRAYRIGQKKNVLVHKFICRGTIEEKIDALIRAKKNLAEDLLGQGGEILLTELSDAELLNVVALDIHRAMGET
jgi:non-specific serine/threonine protein kinase